MKDGLKLPFVQPYEYALPHAAPRTPAKQAALTPLVDLYMRPVNDPYKAFFISSEKPSSSS